MGWLSRSAHAQVMPHTGNKYSCDGCMIASCMPRNFAHDQLVGIVHPGISQVACMKATSFDQVEVLELKLPGSVPSQGRCAILGYGADQSISYPG